MSTTPSKPAPSLRNVAPERTLPPRIAEFLAAQIPRAARITLCQQTMGQPQVVDSWPRGTEKLKASELAAEAWALAVEDSGSMALGNAAKYMLLVTPKEGGDGARLGFTVPIVRTNDATPPFRADAEGVIAQTMAHLTVQTQASQAMLVEGLEGLFVATRTQLEETRKARESDQARFESVIQAYKELLSAQNEGNKISADAANKQIALLSSAYNAQASKTLELIPTIEALSSEKHARDLAAARQARSEARKDKAVDYASSLVFPMLAAKFGGLALPPKPAAPSAAPAPAASSPAAAPPATTSGPQFGPRSLRAIEEFLAALNQDELEGIMKALRPETAALFNAIGAALHAEVAERQAAPAPTPANGVANGAAAKGHVS